jgi:hypothetical protein
MNTKFLLLAIAGAVVSTAAIGQSGPPSVNATVINTPSNPVPVTVQGGEQTVTVYNASISVTTPVYGNHGTGALDVAAYKQVRLVISDGSCGPCGAIVAAVFVSPPTGSPYQIDQFPVDTQGAGVALWATRTYEVPGANLSVSLRSMTSGTVNSVRVAVFGRAN